MKLQRKCACADEIPEREILKRVDKIVSEQRAKAGALIPVLQIIQGLFGYLPKPALKQVSLRLDKPYSEVAGVAGFYSFFSTTPRGNNLVRVCLGTACYVRGGKQVLESLRKDLGIDVGGTTPDREFTLEVGRCFGACGLAPVVMVNDDTHQRVKPARVQELLAPYKVKKSSAKRRSGK